MGLAEQAINWKKVDAFFVHEHSALVTSVNTRLEAKSVVREKHAKTAAWWNLDFICSEPIPRER